MLMCREATRLMSLKQDRPLSLREGMSLHFHLVMCNACRRCDRQFTLLHGLGERFEHHLERQADAATAKDKTDKDE